MDIVTVDGVALRTTPDKGRGVFALRDFEPLALILVNPILVLGAEDAKTIERTSLGYYHFVWPYDPDGLEIGLEASPYSCLPFGLISLINHAGGDQANATWEFSAADMTITALAVRPIKADEEILWNYNWIDE